MTQPAAASDSALPWWETAFGTWYLHLYAHRDDASAVAEVQVALPRLRAAPGPLLDAACGNGRHLAALRAEGLPAYGFDYSTALLPVAARRVGVAGRLVRADLRQLPFAPGWGAITLFFTAFGYFDDVGNAAVLQALLGLLAPGGWLMLDLPEPEHLRQTLVPSSRREPLPGLVVEERRCLRGQRVEKAVHARNADGGELRFCESVRLYTADELAALAAPHGGQLYEVWSSLHGPARNDGRQVLWFRREE